MNAPSALLLIASVACWLEALRHYRRPVLLGCGWVRRPIGPSEFTWLGIIAIPWAAWRAARRILRVVHSWVTEPILTNARLRAAEASQVRQLRTELRIENARRRLGRGRHFTEGMPS